MNLFSFLNSFESWINTHLVLRFWDFILEFTVELSEVEDGYEWVVDGRLEQRYKTGVIYTYLKGSQPTVPWAKIVWISYSIPRHNFLTWLVLLDRCPTRDMLNGWGLNVDPLCLLCDTAQKSRNHLFFEFSPLGMILSLNFRTCEPIVTLSASRF
ncbi:hypothetical protein F2Q69_00056634 [Brassica cretica]|uniref:Reverse transcriptase zinc-binding domain-containing protein n=1 Tax=Brassica cretica TaxID=69181 RepID=A0A8S9MQX7_BRACR|nr:hypothetical protein F2Q69_00056634 [Brassica cretica]